MKDESSTFEIPAIDKVVVSYDEDGCLTISQDSQMADSIIIVPHNNISLLIKLITQASGVK